MFTEIKSKRIILPDGITDGYLYIEGDKIIGVSKSRLSHDREVDLGELYLSPGFIDIHTHGAAGVDYSTAGDVTEALRAVKCQLTHGATTVFPTVTSSELDRTLSALGILKEAKSLDEGRSIAGIHLEGPFLSENQCGAQDKSLITPPRAEFYTPVLEKYGDIISRWDYAPERDSGNSFCRHIVNYSVLPSAAHTDATYEDILSSFECGMRLITHLYSCTSTITRRSGFRKLGVIESAYLIDGLYAEIIADGKHLPPELLRLIFKTKDNSKIILVTDSLAPAGTDAKVGRVGGVDCIIEDGVCKLPDRSAFAGSVAMADTLVRVLVKEAGIDIVTAVACLTKNPAELFGLNKGVLEAGRDADIVAFDDEISVKQVFLSGERVV